VQTCNVDNFVLVLAWEIRCGSATRCLCLVPLACCYGRQTYVGRYTDVVNETRQDIHSFGPLVPFSHSRINTLCTLLSSTDTVLGNYVVLSVHHHTMCIMLVRVFLVTPGIRPYARCHPSFGWLRCLFTGNGAEWPVRSLSGICMSI